MLFMVSNLNYKAGFRQVDKIICLGKNYADHASEMGDSPSSLPVVFLKPSSTRRQVGRSGEKITTVFPDHGSQVHPECEVVVWISQGGFRLTPEESERRIGWVTVGLDVTLRDLQTELKKAGHPWTLSKVFPDSAILGPWILRKEFPQFMETEFRLLEDGRTRQQAVPSSMLMKPAEAISWISQYFPLLPGDVLYTGTPAGVGKIHPGDVLRLEWGKIHYEVKWDL